jgi:hypothetical protein
MKAFSVKQVPGADNCSEAGKKWKLAATLRWKRLRTFIINLTICVQMYHKSNAINNDIFYTTNWATFRSIFYYYYYYLFTAIGFAPGGTVARKSHWYTNKNEVK